MSQWLAVRTPQVSPSGQVPQSSTSPHPSLATPQSTPSDSQVVGVHSASTTAHRLGSSAPQTSPAAQVPHSTTPPHRVSVTVPQSTSRESQLLGHAEELPPPPAPAFRSSRS